MAFEPKGGFPSLIREDDIPITEQTLESRGFGTTNIVNISNIMENKKKENLFIAFGSEEEDGAQFLVEKLFTDHPNEYQNIEYKNLPNKLKRSAKK